MPAGFDVVGHMKHPPYFGVSQDPGHEAAVSSFCHEMTVRNVRGIALFDHEDGESTKRLTTIAMVCRALVRPLGKPLKGQLTGKFALRQAFLSKKPVKTLQRQGANLILVTDGLFLLDQPFYQGRHPTAELQREFAIRHGTPPRGRARLCAATPHPPWHKSWLTRWWRDPGCRR
jgi:hypothetical protein